MVLPLSLIDLGPAHQGAVYIDPRGDKPSDQHSGGSGIGCSRRGGSAILNISIYLLAFI